MNKVLSEEISKRRKTVTPADVEAFYNQNKSQLKGEPLSSETSVNKLHRAELEVEMGDFALELCGNAHQYLRGADEAVDGGRWASGALNWPEVVIGGGTPNIQKNIIAERILGLPKDP